RAAVPPDARDHLAAARQPRALSHARPARDRLPAERGAADPLADGVLGAGADGRPRAMARLALLRSRRERAGAPSRRARGDRAARRTRLSVVPVRPPPSVEHAERPAGPRPPPAPRAP